MINETRRFIRLHIMLNVNYRISGAVKKGINAFSRDIALGGVNIFMAEKVKKGSLLYLIIKLPGEFKRIYARGRVMWQREYLHKNKSPEKIYLTGIQFSKINLPYKARLFHFLITNLKSYRENKDKQIMNKIERMRHILCGIDR